MYVDEDVEHDGNALQSERNNVTKPLNPQNKTARNKTAQTFLFEDAGTGLIEASATVVSGWDGGGWKWLKEDTVWGRSIA